MTTDTTPTFDKTLSALKQRNRNEWDIADALLAEVTPSKRGIRTGQKGTWEDLSDALAENGIDYSVSTLRQYRDTAAAWAPDDRIDGVSFTAHRYAKKASDPAAVIERIKTLKGRVTTEDVKAAVATPAQTKTARYKDAAKDARKLIDLLAAVDARFVKNLAGNAQGIALLEDIKKGMGSATPAIQKGLDSKSAKSKAAAASKAAPSTTKTAPKPKTSKTARKGRVRG